MAVDDIWYLSKKDADGNRIKAKKYGRGKRWRVRYVDDAGEPQEKMFARKPDAEAYDVNMRADVNRGQYIDPGAGKMLVRDYGEQWRHLQLHAGNTASRIERTLRLHVNPHFGRLMLMEVRTSHVKAWVKRLDETLAPASVKVVYQVALQMFSDAVLDRRIGATPFVRKISLPDGKPAKRHITTPEKVHQLAEALPAWLSAQVYVASGCGHRAGEIWGIEPHHIDWLAREIHIMQQVCACGARDPHLALPKGEKTRTVELADGVIEALAWHIQQHPPTPRLILDETNKRKPVTRMASLVFTTSDGKPLRQSTWNYRWNKATAAAGLPDGFGIHDLRHYYATSLIHGGADVKTVQLALGHATPMITFNTYLGEWPEGTTKTRGLIDAAMGKPRLHRAAG